MGIARLRGCADGRLFGRLYYSDFIEGVARMRGCTDAQLFGRVHCTVVY